MMHGPINISDFLIFITYVRGRHYGYSLRPPKHVATPLVRAELRPEQIEIHCTIFALRSFHGAAVRSSHNYEPSPTPSVTWAARLETASGTAVISDAFHMQRAAAMSNR